jgi:hypothetical protein
MIENIFQHKLLSILGIIASIIGLLAEFFLNRGVGGYIYLGIFIIIMLALIWVAIDEYKRNKFFKNSQIHIPVVINVDSSKPSNHIFNLIIERIEKLTGINNYEDGLKKYLNIVRNDLVYEFGTGLANIYQKEKLFSFLQIISYNLNKIQSSLKSKVIFHVAYYVRPSVGFAVGVVFENDEVIVYQNNPDKDIFDEIGHTKERNYKTNVKNFEKFDIKKIENGEGDEILVAINASSHKVNLNTDSLKKYKNIIVLNARHNGTIKLDEDWMQYVREIFTVLNELQIKYKHIVIAHAMPESIALLVGMAIGNYWNITITQYDNLEYKKVFNMKEIKLYY